MTCRSERLPRTGSLAALLAAGLLLAACNSGATGRASAGGPATGNAATGSPATGGAQASEQQESSSAAAIRRFHSPLRQGPSGR